MGEGGSEIYRREMGGGSGKNLQSMGGGGRRKFFLILLNFPPAHPYV